MLSNNQIFNDEPVPAAAPDESPKKRNSGRTGPTSSSGRAKSALNATKHGGCAHTLVLPDESQEDCDTLIARWLNNYNPADGSLDHDFVLKAAQAEWARLRNQKNYDGFLASTCGVNPFNWDPDQIKKHDLLLRYKTAAERCFQREYRLLQQHLKSQQPKPSKESTAKREQEPVHTELITRCDTSPTGYYLEWEHPAKPGVIYPHPIPPPTYPHPNRPPAAKSSEEGVPGVEPKTRTD